VAEFFRAGGRMQTEYAMTGSGHIDYWCVHHEILQYIEKSRLPFSRQAADMHWLPVYRISSAELVYSFHEKAHRNKPARIRRSIHSALHKYDLNNA